MKPREPNGGTSAARSSRLLGALLTPEQLEEVKIYIEDRVESDQNR
jgi:hypothetical protein